MCRRSARNSSNSITVATCGRRRTGCWPRSSGGFRSLRKFRDRTTASYRALLGDSCCGPSDLSGHLVCPVSTWGVSWRKAKGPGRRRSNARETDEGAARQARGAGAGRLHYLLRDPDCHRYGRSDNSSRLHALDIAVSTQWGKPLHVHGLLADFDKTARSNAAMLRNLASTGIELVGIDPSMTLTYRSEYRQALGPEAPHVHLLQEWLAKRLNLTTDPQVTAGRYWLLPHCTERTNAAAATDDWKIVFRSLGADLTILPSGCCGMAGAYGYAVDQRKTSRKIYGQSWRSHVRNSEFKGRLVASGHSCRCQVKMADGIDLPHPARALLNSVIATHAATASKSDTGSHVAR